MAEIITISGDKSLQTEGKNPLKGNIKAVYDWELLLLSPGEPKTHLNGLPLDTTGGISREQLIHFVDTHPVYVAGDRMLEAGSGDRKAQGIRVGLAGQQPEDQAGREGVPAPDAVDDIGDVIVRADDEILAVVQAARPAVMIGAETFAQGDRLHLQVWKCLQHLFTYRPVFIGIQCSGLDILLPGTSFQADAQCILAVLLIGDAHVHKRDDLGPSLREPASRTSTGSCDSCNRTRRSVRVPWHCGPPAGTILRQSG